MGNAVRKLVVLCFIAGYVDGYGYTQIGGVFAANMTGNTVLFAIHAARGEWSHVADYGLTLIAFFLGGMVASALGRALQRPHLLLLLEAALILATQAPGLSAAGALMLLAAAMGIQGKALSRFGRASVPTVVLTNNLLRLGDGLVDRLWPKSVARGDPADESAVRMTATACVTYAVGAAATVATTPTVVPAALALPAILLVLLSAEMARERTR